MQTYSEESQDSHFVINSNTRLAHRHDIHSADSRSSQFATECKSYDRSTDTQHRLSNMMPPPSYPWFSTASDGVMLCLIECLFVWNETKITNTCDRGTDPRPPRPQTHSEKDSCQTQHTLTHTQIILVLSKWHLDVAPSFFVFFSLILVIQEGCRDKALSRGRWLGKDDRESPLTFFNKSSERAKNSICSCAKLASGAGDTADLYFLEHMGSLFLRADKQSLSVKWKTRKISLQKLWDLGAAVKTRTRLRHFQTVESNFIFGFWDFGLKQKWLLSYKTAAFCWVWCFFFLRKHQNQIVFKSNLHLHTTILWNE